MDDLEGTTLKAELKEPAEKGQTITPPRPTLQLARRTWQGVAAALFLIAVSWGACGLLLGEVPSEPSASVPNPESTDFWVTRGFCLGPAFVLIFLAYLAFMAGRRRDGAVHRHELIAALGMALGLLPTLLGFAIVVQPASSDPQRDRIFASLLCMLPGLFITALSAIFWVWSRARKEF